MDSSVYQEQRHARSLDGGGGGSADHVIPRVHVERAQNPELQVVHKDVAPHSLQHLPLIGGAVAIRLFPPPGWTFTGPAPTQRASACPRLDLRPWDALRAPSGDAEFGDA